MFEKEAEEEINKEHWTYSIFKDLAQEYWQKGAEFGYNKANEWHYVKDGDLPKEEKDYLTYSKAQGLQIKHYFSDCKIFNDLSYREVIAWKEIVLPKEIKEK